MKTVKIIGAALALTAATVLVLAVRKPNAFRVERTIVIDAPPAKVFEFLDDPRRQSEWSPWDKKDSSMRKIYSGAPKGVGAIYEWDGDRNIGAGRLEIVQVIPSSKVVMDLHFLRPMEGRNVAEYDVAPQRDGGSIVTWSIRGPMPFLSKVMCVFLNMDRMIGKEFEAGLADLKALVEKKRS
jgi:uncharacterized protein YndB with AHSA1/START domain